jgi:hypothetical protein
MDSRKPKMKQYRKTIDVLNVFRGVAFQSARKRGRIESTVTLTQGIGLWVASAAQQQPRRRRAAAPPL